MSKMWALGTSESLLSYEDQIKTLQGENILGFHRFFPYGFQRWGVVPRYWTWADPDAAMPGLIFLNQLKSSELGPFRAMEVLVPRHISDTYEVFRQHAGTTPLGRAPNGWFAYKYYLEEAERRGITIKQVDSVTTKHLAGNPELMPEIAQNIENSLRFEQKKVLLGTVPYDSESVAADSNIWGLENKLSSTVFPIAQNLGATELYVAGFDCVGGRFYEVSGQAPIQSGKRHPWNDETQKEPVYNIPLLIIKKWADWAEKTGMNVYNVVEDKYTLLNKVLPYVDFETAVK
tara:strand:+ start:387 stop:1253 length:867 start_codon:yes stop_codon:yes gene_type:complete